MGSLQEITTRRKLLGTAIVSFAGVGLVSFVGGLIDTEIYKNQLNNQADNAIPKLPAAQINSIKQQLSKEAGTEGVLKAAGFSSPTVPDYVPALEQTIGHETFTIPNEREAYKDFVASDERTTRDNVFINGGLAAFT